MEKDDSSTTFNILTDNVITRSANSISDIVNMQKSKSSGFLQLTEYNSEAHDGDIEMGLSLTENVDSPRQFSDENCDMVTHSQELENSHVEQLNNNLENRYITELFTRLLQNVYHYLQTYHTNEKWKKIIKQIIHYYTHFLMFVIFEILFYFNYVVQYEQKLVYELLKNAIDDIIQQQNGDIPTENICNFYSNVCVNLVDGRTNTQNTKIYDNALYLIYGMSGFLLFLVVIETNRFSTRSTFPKEFFKSMHLMFFVGVFDYLFFNYFILKYKIIDTPKLMCDLYENGGYC